jgi:hypothetical protein
MYLMSQSIVEPLSELSEFLDMEEEINPKMFRAVIVEAPLVATSALACAAVSSFQAAAFNQDS